MSEFKCSEKNSISLHDISMVLAHLPRIISIRTNNREDHPTLETSFIARRVSLVRFLRDPEGIRVDFVLLNLQYEQNYSKSHSNLDDSLTSSRPKKFFIGLHDIAMILPHFSRIISIRRNKREGHTTIGSILIAGKVSLVRFFGHLKGIYLNFM